MKKSDIYEISIKILGIYLFFNSIVLMRELFGILYVYGFGRGNQDSGMDKTIPSDWIPLSILSLTLSLLFASLLTFKTNSIVKLICRREDFDEKSSLFAERKVIYEMAIMIMGLVLVMWSFPDWVKTLRDYFNTRGQDPSYRQYSFSSDALFLYSLKIIIGATSAYFAKPIAERLAKEKS